MFTLIVYEESGLCTYLSAREFKLLSEGEGVGEKEGKKEKKRWERGRKEGKEERLVGVGSKTFHFCLPHTINSISSILGLNKVKYTFDSESLEKSSYLQGDIMRF